MVIVYIIGAWGAFDFYTSLEAEKRVACDDKVLQVILDKEYKLEEARQVACTTTEYIGHPMGYTVLLTTIFGTGPAIFGFYVNSGRRKDDPIPNSRTNS